MANSVMSKGFFERAKQSAQEEGLLVKNPAGSTESGAVETSTGAGDYSFEKTQEEIDRQQSEDRDKEFARRLMAFQRGLALGPLSYISDAKDGAMTYIANKLGLSENGGNRETDLLNIDPADLENASLLETISTIRDARVALSEDYPVHTLVGETLMTLPLGVAGAQKFATTQLGRAVAGSGFKKAAQRAGIAAGAGAAGGVVLEGGSGRAKTPRDLMIAAVAGGVGGAGGQVLGEAVGPAARAAGSVVNPMLQRAGLGVAQGAAEDVGALRAASKVFGGDEVPMHPQGYTAQLGREPVTREQAQNLVNSLDPDGSETLANRRPFFEEVAESVTASPSAAEGAKTLVQRNEKIIDEAEKKARELLDSAISPEKNSSQAKAAFKKNREALAPVYDDILDKGHEATEAFPTVKQLAEDLRASFGDDNLKSAAVRDEVIDRMTRVGRGTDKKDFGEVILNEAGEEVHVAGPRALLALKKDLDNMIAERIDNEPALDKDTVRKLVNYKKKIDDQLETIMPGYSKVAASYADEATAQNARKMGAELFSRSGGRSASDVSDFKEYYKSLPKAEQHFFKEGVFDYISNIDAKKPTGAYKYLISQFGRGVTDSMYLAKLKVVLGPDKVKSLMRKAEKMQEGVKHSETLLGNVTNRASKENLSSNMMSKMVDAITVVANVFKDRGRPSSRSVVPGRRLAASPDEISSSIIADISAGSKKEANEGLAAIEKAVKRRDERGSLIPGILGGVVGGQSSGALQD